MGGGKGSVHRTRNGKEAKTQAEGGGQSGNRGSPEEALGSEAGRGEEVARAAPADISLEQLSNPWPLSVGASPSNGGGGGNGPNVAISFSPSPVPNSGGGTWNHSVTISEIGGASVTLTSLNVGGTEYSSRISQWFQSNQLPANGKLSGSS